MLYRTNRMTKANLTYCLNYENRLLICEWGSSNRFVVRSNALLEIVESRSSIIIIQLIYDLPCMDDVVNTKLLTIFCNNSLDILSVILTGSKNKKFRLLRPAI